MAIKPVKVHFTAEVEENPGGELRLELYVFNPRGCLIHRVPFESAGIAQFELTRAQARNARVFVAPRQPASAIISQEDMRQVRGYETAWIFRAGGTVAQSICVP